jgi:uncharacterized protein (TIGR03086 family)
MADPDRIELLSRALDQTLRAIHSIAPEQRTLPTPCPDWDVRALVTHAIDDLEKFDVAARGEKVDWTTPPDELGDDWESEFRSNAYFLLETWRTAEPDVLPRADQQIAEFAMHSWDITRATGQSTDLDPEIAEHALAWSKQMLKPEYRGAGGGGAFGPEVPVPDDAPVYDRLAGWFGRDPHQELG